MQLASLTARHFVCWADLLGDIGENVDANVLTKRGPDRQTFYNLVNKLRSMGQETKHKNQVLTDEKLDDIGARIEHTTRKSLKPLAEDT
jgi:IMP dehydrogenase/GMP reductase